MRGGLKYGGVTAERPSLEEEGLGILRPPPQEAQQRHLNHL